MAITKNYYLNRGEYSELAYTKPVNSVFRALWLVWTAHGSDDIASRFLESLSEAQISEIKKAIPINKKKATKFGFSVFQYKILLLNIIYT